MHTFFRPDVDFHAEHCFLSTTPLSGTLPSTSASRTSLDMDKYIPLGCLRLERATTNIAAETWTSCVWFPFPRPRLHEQNDVSSPQYKLSKMFFDSITLRPFWNLHEAGWVRFEFMMKNAELGRVRVHVLAEDIGRRDIDRSNQKLRTSLISLMGKIDVSKETWGGHWSSDSPVVL